MAKGGRTRWIRVVCLRIYTLRTTFLRDPRRARSFTSFARGTRQLSTSFRNFRKCCGVMIIFIAASARPVLFYVGGPLWSFSVLARFRSLVSPVPSPATTLLQGGAAFFGLCSIKILAILVLMARLRAAVLRAQAARANRKTHRVPSIKKHPNRHKEARTSISKFSRDGSR